ncbi:MAG TPA: hypothetical protein VGY75_10595 [Candidatus Udaeobacter sp.]|jgi:hypothetical protein|nr:hypothetical protein [Candidatus Udaeobacter sp.]
MMDGLFARDELVMLTGSSAGVPVVDTFKTLAPRFENFQSICINPVVGPRFRVPTRRQNIVITFPGISLVAQFARAYYLGRILPLRLAVFVPAEMACEFWFSAGDAAANKKFARAAFKLGYNAGNPFDPGFMASVPCASSPFQPPAAAVAMLRSIGVERRDDRKNLVLFKRETELANN